MTLEDEIMRIAAQGRLYRAAHLTPKSLERFAALAASKEREACAKAAEDELRKWPFEPNVFKACTEIAEAIRARGR